MRHRVNHSARVERKYRQAVWPRPRSHSSSVTRRRHKTSAQRQPCSCIDRRALAAVAMRSRVRFQA
eukprot:4290326-Prymnesium_polylepis.1